MIKSMTGYGRAQALVDGKDIIVEIKSVNHRYFDFSCRVPRCFSYLEEKIKSVVAGAISRGKIEVYISVSSYESSDVEVRLNRPLLESYLKAFSQMEKEYSFIDDKSIMAISRIPEILLVEKQPEDEQKVWDSISIALSDAINDFVDMRTKEGRRLFDDLNMRGEGIMTLINEIERRAPQIEKEFSVRLKTKIEELLDNVSIDESRLLTEVAIFADRSSITEEIVRIKSHLNQYFSMIGESNPIGRKIDFLLQELNRETNTIGSKCNDLDITKMVVEIKSELEKIREQVQNIE